MKLRSIWISVFSVVLIALIVLAVGLKANISPDAPEVPDELAAIDPTDMSQYYAMGEYYPPNDVDTLNIEWHGGRVEVAAYNGSDYYVEEAATRYLLENERLSYSLEGTAFSVRFSDSEENTVTDAYKKIEIRVPRALAQNLKSVNIETDGEVVLKNITVGSVTINGKQGNVTAKNAYSSDTQITTTDGKVSLEVSNNIGYSVDFSSKKGTLSSYVDNGLDKYVSGDGKYPFKVRTKTGDLTVSLAEIEEEQA